MRTKSQTRLSILLTVLLIFALCGCKSVNKLRSAQDAFNQAAALDNQQNLKSINEITASESRNTLAQQNESALLYQHTNQILNSFTDSEKSDLKKDKLYGNYVVLKGLTNWKLGNHDIAYNASTEAANNEIDFTARDRAIIQIIPALIAIEEARPFYLRASDTPDNNCINLNRVMSIIKNTPLKRIESVINDKNTPVNLKIYAIQSELLGHHYRIEAFRSAEDSDTPSCIAPSYTERIKESEGRTTTLLENLKVIQKIPDMEIDQKELQKIINYWKSLTDE